MNANAMAEKPNALTLAPRLARLLGWEISRSPNNEPDRDRVVLARPGETDGPKILLLTGYAGDDRLEVSGIGPRMAQGWTGTLDCNPKRIGVDPRRPAEAIAREISRRFLPGYLAAFDRAKGRIMWQSACNDAAAESAERIASRFGARVSQNSDRTQAGVVFTEIQRVTVYADHETCKPMVEICVNGLDEETAIRVLEIIQARK